MEQWWNDTDRRKSKYTLIGEGPVPVRLCPLQITHCICVCMYVSMQAAYMHVFNLYMRL
jgi:hypothetical protein